MKRISLVLFLVLSLAVLGYSMTYYVNSAADAGGDGTTWALTGAHRAFKTIAQVNAASFSPGDSVLFNRGDIWREQLTIPSSGSAGRPITFGAYGTGALPILNGSDVVSTWTAVSGGAPNLWKATEAKAVGHLIFNANIWGVRRKDITQLSAEYQWALQGGQLYCYADTNPGSRYASIEASTRAHCIYMNSKSHITITGLMLVNAKTHNFQSYDASNYLMVDGITTAYACQCGIQVGSTTAKDAYAGIIIKNNTTYMNGQRGIITCNYASGTIIEGNNSTYDGINPDEPYTAGIECIPIAADPDANDSPLIQNNTVMYAGYYNNNGGTYFASTNNGGGHGIWFDTITHGGVIRYNLVAHCRRCGIHLEKNVGSQCYYNIVYDTNGTSTSRGIWISNTDDASRTCDGNKVYNNVCYNNKIGIGLSCGNYGLVITNNQIINNISVGNSSMNLHCDHGADNDGVHGIGNLYTYNCLGVAFTGFIGWGTRAYKSTYAEWETAYGGTTHSVQADPQFLNTIAGGENFRLQPTSPCTNAGIDVGLTRDYVGTTVPRGAAPDVGAYEHAGLVIPLVLPLNLDWKLISAHPARRR